MSDFATQMQEIECLQKQIKGFYDKDYTVLIADETLFHPDHYKLRHWMPIGNPIMKVTKYSAKMPKVNVCSVISESLGNIHNHYSEKYFCSTAMTEVLQAVRDLIGPEVKIVMFWDGARIHNSEETRSFAQRADIDIELCQNIRYRCDLNPCELFFRRAKHDYAKELERLKALNHPWQQEEMVKYVLDQISPDFVKK